MYLKQHSFEMTKSTQTVKINITSQCMELTKIEKLFVNLYVYDPEGNLRAQRLFAGEPVSFILSENYASSGCRRGNIPKGTWQVILLSEKEIPDLEYAVQCLVDIGQPMSTKTCIKGESGKEAWYKGDFHAHTDLSDGSIKLEEVPDILEKNRLDFIFLTDHNMIHTHLEQYRGIFSGTELTLQMGHMNLQGLQEVPFTNYHYMLDFLKKEDLSMRDLLKEIKAANLSINHPFMKPWHYTYGEMPLDRIGTLEVICDPTWKTAREDNELAIRFIRFLWASGHKITAIGGSDAHLPYGKAYEWASTPSWYGDPATFVYAKGLEQNHILEGLKKGHVYISRGVRLDLIINNGKYLPGDRVRERSLSYYIGSPDITFNTYVHLIINGKRKCTKELKPSSVANFRVRLSKDYKSISLEVRDEDNQFLACVNPVYYGRRSPAFTTWQQAIEAFSLQEGVRV